LISGFVNRPVAIERFRNRQRLAFGFEARDQLWLRPRAETRIGRHCFRRSELQYAQSILSVGHVRKQAGIRHRHLHLTRIVELATGVIKLLKVRFFRILYVDNRDAFYARGDIGIGARNINILSVSQPQSRPVDDARLLG
jgi:hypothetical protein